MKYCLFELSFTTPVHFGSSALAHSLDSSEMICHADTLFSALCHAAMSLGGTNKVNWLIRQVQKDVLRFSDCMPYQNEYRYLPRPCWQPKERMELPTADRKFLKKAEWVSMDERSDCLSALQGKKIYGWGNTGNKSLFGENIEAGKAFIPVEEDAAPYTVGLFQFHPNCGLYFILQYANDDAVCEIKKLVEALGYSGIGGEISSGYGKFSLKNMILLSDAEENSDVALRWLYQALTKRNSTHWMLLSASLPTEYEMEQILQTSCFQLVRRGGFTHPIGENNMPLKKQTQYFLTAGSIVEQQFSGEVYDVGMSTQHPIYRYARPVMLGVAL